MASASSPRTSQPDYFNQSNLDVGPFRIFLNSRIEDGPGEKVARSVSSGCTDCRQVASDSNKKFFS